MIERSQLYQSVQMDSVYGNCYTFAVNLPQLEHAVFIGPTYGLRLILYTDESENYLDSLTGAVGWRVRCIQLQNSTCLSIAIF